MTAAFAAGAAIAAGLLLLWGALFPREPGLAERITTLDRLRDHPGQASAARLDRAQRLGAAVAAFYTAHGWQLRRLRQDLALLDRPLEAHLATKTILASYGVVAALLLAMLRLRGGPVPIWIALAGAVTGFVGPDVWVHARATAARRDLRRVLAAYLDWVACCLAGGRGVPEALALSARLGHGPSLRRIGDTVDAALPAGITPWEALGRLGERTGVDELRDLAAPLGLVADEGAKVRASLLARAETMRQRELAAIEAHAGIRSQTMILAQVPLFLAFLLYLIYPALVQVLTLTT